MAASGEVAMKREQVLEQLRRVAPRSRDGRHVLDLEAIGRLLKRLDPTKWTSERISTMIAGLELDQDGKIDVEAFVDFLHVSPAKPLPQEVVPKDRLQ